MNNNNKGLGTVGAIVIIAIIVGAGIFGYYILRNNNNISGVFSDISVTNSVTPSPGTNTSTSPIPTLNNAQSLQDLQNNIGKNAAVTDTIIQKVYSNRVFLVGNGTDQELLVVLDSNTSIPNDVKIQSGQVVALAGTIQRTPSVSQISSTWNINSNAAADISTSHQVYLAANKILNPQSLIQSPQQQNQSQSQ